MTVQELIDQLKQFPPGIKVVANDGEESAVVYGEVKSVTKVRIIPDYNVESFLNPHLDIRALSEDDLKRLMQREESAVLLGLY